MTPDKAKRNKAFARALHRMAVVAQQIDPDELTLTLAQQGEFAALMGRLDFICKEIFNGEDSLRKAQAHGSTGDSETMVREVSKVQTVSSSGSDSDS